MIRVYSERLVDSVSWCGATTLSSLARHLAAACLLQRRLTGGATCRPASTRSVRSLLSAASRCLLLAGLCNTDHCPVCHYSPHAAHSELAPGRRRFHSQCVVHPPHNGMTAASWERTMCTGVLRCRDVMQRNIINRNIEFILKNHVLEWPSDTWIQEGREGCPLTLFLKCTTEITRSPQLKGGLKQQSYVENEKVKIGEISRQYEHHMNIHEHTDATVPVGDCKTGGI